MKPIKRTVEMNLHELIKFIWNNGIKDEAFSAVKARHDMGNKVYVHANGSLSIGLEACTVVSNDRYKVEVEERINKSTVFDEIIFILKYPNGKRRLVRKFGISVNDVLDMNSLVVEIHALIDGDADYILVWEAD